VTPVTILGTGLALPAREVSAAEVELLASLPTGWVMRHSGVRRRFFAELETSSSLGAKAALQALQRAGLELSQVDCLVAACGTYEQALPCRASLIHRQLGLSHLVPAFDVDSTCLSFLTALDLLSLPVAAGRYHHVLIVSADLASPGLNWSDPESCTLFGDGAAAAVIGSGPRGRILACAMETHSEASALCEIRGGGSRIHPRHYTPDREAEFLFAMNGPALFRLVAQALPPFFDRLLQKARVSRQQVLVIPHQASQPSLEKLRRRLALPPERFFNVVADYGNLIAASLPAALHLAVEGGHVKRGDKVVLLGTSAGVSLGGMVLEF